TVTGSASTHQRSPANGRSSSVQPSGSTQVSQDGPLAPVASPTARARNATPSTPTARPRAGRELGRDQADAGEREAAGADGQRERGRAGARQPEDRQDQAQQADQDRVGQ